MKASFPFCWQASQFFSTALGVHTGRMWGSWGSHQPQGTNGSWWQFAELPLVKLFLLPYFFFIEIGKINNGNLFLVADLNTNTAWTSAAVYCCLAIMMSHHNYVFLQSKVKEFKGICKTSPRFPPRRHSFFLSRSNIMAQNGISKEETWGR